MTVREALSAGSTSLRAAGIDSPHLDASLLMAEVLHMSRSALMAAGPQPLGETSLETFNVFIQRRLAGESVAYILGRKEFYGLELRVNPAVLVPRPDTETLVEAALAELAAMGAGLSVLDLCTGSGAVAIALKHEMPGLEVWASDISAEALDTARVNAAECLDTASGRTTAIHFCQGSLYEAFPGRSYAPFHLIAANPPYVPTGEIAGLSPEVRAEPMQALDGGSDGLDLIRKIVSGAPALLCPGGRLLLEADPRQMQTIASLLTESGFTGIHTYRDLSGRERVIGGKNG